MTFAGLGRHGTSLPGLYLPGLYLPGLYLPGLLLPGLLAGLALLGPVVPGAAAAAGGFDGAGGEPFGEALSPGDRVRVDVLLDDYFDGKYQVSQSGALHLPHLPELPVGGATLEAAGARLGELFAAQGIYPPGQSVVSVSVLSWSEISVSVRGEVFFPGELTLNRPTEATAPRPTDEVPGAALPRRRLEHAVRAAGGVTPWADLGAVRILRGDHELRVDLSGAITGEGIEAIYLIDGDRVVVPRAGDTLQPELARPSPITMPGIKIHVSNLIVPANNNAGASLEPSIGLPYGSRLGQAVVAGNCAGGANATNARRHVWWVRTHREAGTVETLRVSVRELLQEASPEINPILFEGDAVVCFDSKVTNFREILRTVGEMFLPYLFYREVR